VFFCEPEIDQTFDYFSFIFSADIFFSALPFFFFVFSKTAPALALLPSSLS